LFVVPQFNFKPGKRISDEISICTGEMFGIMLVKTLGWIEEITPLRSLVCSDSESYSFKHNHSNSRPDLLVEIQKLLLIVYF
jgi:hypothetical protein